MFLCFYCASNKWLHDCCGLNLFIFLYLLWFNVCWYLFVIYVNFLFVNFNLFYLFLFIMKKTIRRNGEESKILHPRTCEFVPCNLRMLNKIFVFRLIDIYFKWTDSSTKANFNFRFNREERSTKLQKKNKTNNNNVCLFIKCQT